MLVTSNRNVNSLRIETVSSSCLKHPWYLASRKGFHRGFPGSSFGKESTCNAGDPRSIPGSGRSTGEGLGYPLQDSGLENSVDSIVHGLQRVRYD